MISFEIVATPTASTMPYFVITFFFINLCTHSVLTDEDVKDLSFLQLLHLWLNLLLKFPLATNKDVKFYLHTRLISEVQLPFENSNDIDPTKNTKFIIHGYIDSHKRSWYHRLTDAFLEKGDFNVIQVGWGRLAQANYITSVINTKLIGKNVAKLILKHNLDPKKVHLVGHSLGAHISATAAHLIRKKTGYKIRRITGLDPAGPLFHTFLTPKKYKLDPDDADIVDAYHSDGGVLGLFRPVGTFDVYINGGTRVQPQCSSSVPKKDSSSIAERFEHTYCSHTISFIRFTEIINDYKFVCKQCKSWTRRILGLCNSSDDYMFGAEDVDETMAGLCFVKDENMVKV